jgi:hypothetical protein
MVLKILPPLTFRKKWINFQDYQWIVNGPHFFVSHPLYKTPRESCNQNSDYDIIDLEIADSEFLPRTNFIPIKPIKKLMEYLPVLGSKSWIDKYKIVFSGRLSLTGERTLQPAILPPTTSHIHAVTSAVFDTDELKIEVCGLSSSLIYDFYIKSLGKSGLAADMNHHKVESL